MGFLPQTAVDEVGANTAPDKRYLSLTKIQEEKELRIRFVGEGITGHEAWTTNNKPLRWRVLPEELPSNIRVDDNGSQSTKFFMTGIVYDYEAEIFRVLQISQKTVLENIYKYMKDEDYGDLTGYDLVITRKGSGKETKYSVLAKPPKPLAAAVDAEFKELGWKLDYVFENKNPWDKEAPAEAAAA